MKFPIFPNVTPALNQDIQMTSLIVVFIRIILFTLK